MRALILMVLAAGNACPESSPVASVPAPLEMERLQQGELLLENTSTDENQGAASVTALMHASAQAVWDVIVSCELAAVYVDGLEYCEVLEIRDDYSRTHQIVDKGWASPRLDYIFEAFWKPFRAMDFRLLEGNLKEMEGHWRLQPLPEGLLVSHEIRIRPEFPVPRWLVRRIMMRGMPDLLACIRGLADGSGTPERKAADLERCSGNPAAGDSG